MTGILAIDTSTEACSVAVCVDGQYRDIYEVTPRQHSQRLFGMLRELLPDGDLRAQGIEAIAYGSGPGSFTGLRIAASAVQGLAFSNDLPALPVSSLACQAQTALRLNAVAADAAVLSVLDARINEVYVATCSFERGRAVLQQQPVACAPAAIAIAGDTPLHAVGSGCRFVEEFPAGLQARLQSMAAHIMPSARDLVPAALALLQTGEVQSAEQVQPVYVRDEINWKKLSEQGKQS